MIKHFDLKLNYSRGERLEVNNILIGDLQSTVIDLLNRNTNLSGEIRLARDSFYQGGKN